MFWFPKLRSSGTGGRLRQRACAQLSRPQFLLTFRSVSSGRHAPPLGSGSIRDAPTGDASNSGASTSGASSSGGFTDIVKDSWVRRQLPIARRRNGQRAPNQSPDHPRPTRALFSWTGCSRPGRCPTASLRGGTGRLARGCSSGRACGASGSPRPPVRCPTSRSASSSPRAHLRCVALAARSTTCGTATLTGRWSAPSTTRAGRSWYPFVNPCLPLVYPL